MDDNIAHPPIASSDEWRAQRLELLEAEKALTKHSDQVNAARRRLPMVKVEKKYQFTGSHGKRDLLGLFNGRRQLVVYHFMFDPDWESGCPGCTSFVDSLGDLSMLGEKDTNFVVISRAPLAKLELYKQRKGWDIDWYSSFGSDFNYDYGVTLDENVKPVEYNYRSAADMVARNTPNPTKGEEHGMSVFFRVGDDVFHTYSVYARGTESLVDAYSFLDITPYGRQQAFEDSPVGWPQKPTYG